MILRDVRSLEIQRYDDAMNLDSEQRRSNRYHDYNHTKTWNWNPIGGFGELNQVNHCNLDVATGWRLRMSMSVYGSLYCSSGDEASYTVRRGLCRLRWVFDGRFHWSMSMWGCSQFSALHVSFCGDCFLVYQMRIQHMEKLVVYKHLQVMKRASPSIDAFSAPNAFIRAVRGGGPNVIILIQASFELVHRM